MDTKTDTKPSLRIRPSNRPFGVHLGVHSSPENGSATLYHKASSNRRLEGDCRARGRTALVPRPEKHFRRIDGHENLWTLAMILGRETNPVNQEKLA
jgi:hypothetical protein